jgi:CMP-N-acetylneuraminic acid synthetase
MYENVAIVIPALESNQYYPDGDLISFGDNTLLEWKLSQVMEIAENKNIFISTPSDKIIALSQEYGIQSVKRSDSNGSTQWILESVEPIEKDVILWTHVTSPFISAGDYQAMLEKFFNLPDGYDSLMTVYKEDEYIFFKDKPLNFDINIYESRKMLEPIYRVTNGCYITPKESYLKNRKYFGVSPYYYTVDKLTSLEIKDIGHYEMATSLLSMYFKGKEI